MDFINKKALKENVEMLSNMTGIDKELILNIMEEQVFPKTFRQQISKEALLFCKIDRKTYALDVSRGYLVVPDDKEDFNSECEVKSSNVAGVKVGEHLYEEVDISNKRNNATIAKQILMSEINNLKNNKIKEDISKFDEKLVSIKVKSYDLKKKAYFVDFNNEHSGVLPFENLINETEKLKINERYWAVISEDEIKRFGNQIIFRRKGNEFIKEIFSKEVPEVQNEIIEIKDIYVNSQKKMFISVYTNDKKTDAVGTCVGIRGSRINNIISHFNGASIELFDWNQNLADYIINIFKDMEMESISILDNKVLIFVDEKTMENLSYQNKERLKAINSFVKEKVVITTEEMNTLSNLKTTEYFSKNLDLDSDSAEIISNTGLFKTLDDLVLYSVKDTAEILGVDEEVAEELIETAKNKLIIRNLYIDSVDTNLKDLDSMNNYLLNELLVNDINNMVSLSEFDNVELCELVNIDMDLANNVIMEARDIIYPD